MLVIGWIVDKKQQEVNCSNIYSKLSTVTKAYFTRVRLKTASQRMKGARLICFLFGVLNENMPSIFSIRSCFADMISARSDL